MTATSRVFMDMAIGGKRAGRLIFELFTEDVPITCENFRCLCTGETGLGYYYRPRWYKNSNFYRCIPNFMCQGGDYNRGNGYGGESIYGQYFRDEKFMYKHSDRGVLSMARAHVKHTNSSEFFITFTACPWLDDKHVVFGQVDSGMDVLDAIEEVGTKRGRPIRPVTIYDCGELKSVHFTKASMKREVDAGNEETYHQMKRRPSTNANYINIEEENIIPKDIFKQFKYPL